MRLIIFALLSPLLACAADPYHRSITTSLALASAIDRPLRNMLWISRIDVNAKNSDSFLSSSGVTIASPKKFINSAYDSTVTHDISSFYQKDSYRIKFISSFVLSSPNTIYSLGFDSGVAAQKIQISRSLFLGIARVVHLKNNSHIALSAGSWFGGSIKELPCYDSYDREYWCQNLTAWTDYNPVYPKNYNYVDIKYIYRF